MNEPRSQPGLHGLFVDLTPLSEDDLEQVRAWRNSPEIASFHAARSHISQTQQQQWFQRVRDDRGYQVWVIRDTEGVPLGVAHLKDISWAHARAECGLYIGALDRQGGIYANEAFFLVLEHAFDTLALHKVYGHYLADNRRAIRLNAHFGFEVEATYVDELLIDGQWRDYVRVAVFRDSLMASPGARFLLRRRPGEDQ